MIVEAGLFRLHRGAEARHRKFTKRINGRSRR